jgi:hypothetical protein
MSAPGCLNARLEAQTTTTSKLVVRSRFRHPLGTRCRVKVMSGGNLSSAPIPVGHRGSGTLRM